MSQKPKVRPLSPNDPKNPKTKIKPAKIIRRPPTPKLPRSLGGKSLSDSVVPLRRVILERSKNVKRQQASLANKIDQRGGPKSAAEADVVNRENARQEGQAGNKAAGARAKRQVGRTGKKYLFGRLRKAIDRTHRRAKQHRETGKHGAAVHRAKEVEAELWDRKLSAKHENTNAAYPLTADRVFMFEGSTKNMQKAADAGNEYAKERMQAKKLGRKAGKQLAKDQHWGRAQSTSEKGEEAAAKADRMINPKSDDSYNQRSDARAANRKTKTGERDPRGMRREKQRKKLKTLQAEHLLSILEGKYKDQRMAAERGEAKGALRGPIAKAAIKKLKGSKGKKVGDKVKRATSKAAREAYRRAARSEAGTSKPAKAPEDSLPHPRGGIAGSTEDIQNQIARRGHSR